MSHAAPALRVRSAAAAGPWGTGPDRVEAWLVADVHERDDAAEPESVPGFVVSSFNPMVNAVAGACAEELSEAERAGTALLLATVLGDIVTADTASLRLAEGHHHNPLLFYQSIPNAILGHVARRYGLAGAVTCVAGFADVVGEALEVAEIALLSSDAEQVLLVYVEQASTPRTRALRGDLASADRAAVGDVDIAVGLLLEHGAGAELRIPEPRDPVHPGGLTNRSRLGTAAACALALYLDSVRPGAAVAWPEPAGGGG